MNLSDKPKIDGLISYYGLEDWWLGTLTKTERAYIRKTYKPLGFEKHDLTQGKIVSVSIPVSQYLYGLESWFKSKDDTVIRKKIHDKVVELGYTEPITKPGYYNSRHYTTYIEEVNYLKRDEKLEEVEKLLLELINAVEEENKIKKMGVAPWYYEQLAIVYRKQKDYQKEITILERFLNQKPLINKDNPERIATDRLIIRLEQTKLLASKK